MPLKYFCDFLLFREVTNAPEVRQACVAGKFRSDPSQNGSGIVSILKPHLILDPMQLKAAVSKAVVAFLARPSRMKTRSLDTEIVYYLSSSKSISDALKQVNKNLISTWRWHLLVLKKSIYWSRNFNETWYWK